MPNAIPATEAPQAKKFRKKVDARTWMTIRKGRIMPRSIRVTPRLRRKRGELIIIFRTAKNAKFAKKDL